MLREASPRCAAPGRTHTHLGGAAPPSWATEQQPAPRVLVCNATTARQPTRGGGHGRLGPLQADVAGTLPPGKPSSQAEKAHSKGAIESAYRRHAPWEGRRLLPSTPHRT